MAAQNTVSVPPELMAQIETAARAANQTPDQWAVEAIRQQLEDDGWQRMLKQNERYAQALGISEADVPNLVHQNRMERKS